MKRFFSALILLALFSGCAPQEPLISKQIDAQEAMRRAQAGYTPDEIRNLFVNKTVLYAPAFQPTQVEYYNPSGDAYLWRAGNNVAVQGKWWAQNKTHVCFQYQNSSNPKPQCTSIFNTVALSLDRTEGDIFNLSSSRIPYVLEGNVIYRTLQEVQTRSGTKTN